MKRKEYMALETEDGENIDRRGFLKISALAGTVLGMGMLGGCNPSAGTDDSGSDSSTAGVEGVGAPADETIEADFVIIGGGMGGFAAALTAKEEGIENVVLLEKYASFGGSTLFAEGVFATHSRAQIEAGYPDVDPQAVLDLELEFHHHVINPGLFEKFIEASSENVNWLMDQGVTFASIQVPVMGANCLHIYDGGNGTSAIKIMGDKAINDYGVDARLNIEATDLLLDGDAVVGVRATSENGSIIDFKAPYVLVATGGMAANSEMMEEYTKLDVGKYAFVGGFGADGDGQRMCEKTIMGRAKNVCAMNMWLHVAGADVKSTPNFIGGMEGTNIWVNEKAQRFVSEEIANIPPSLIDCNNAVHSQGRVFSIFDTAHIPFWTENGTTADFSGFCPRGKAIPDIPETLADAVANPGIEYFQADSLADLAAQTGLDAEALEATVDKWNADVATGADSVFGKNPELMFSISEPPFYAARLTNGVLTTVGGIRVNEDGQVCAADGTVVKGLYGAGVAVSGFSGETYSMHAPGTAQGSGLYLGRMAARAAAKA
jgi:fumarate reductase flavoprotein subunit